MKISEQWLREWVNPPINSKVLAEQLTMAGLEVDSIIPAAPPFTKVVVGLITHALQHPDADRLRVCSVDIGQAQPLEIVCGGANARAGIKVAVALVAAVLPGDFIIKQSKIRGVDSSGMLCASKELGLAEESNGIMELLPDAPIGADLRDYLKLDDHIIEIELTPNRGDCLSIQGVARELAAINQLGVLKFDFKELPATIQDTLPIDVQNTQACPRYLGRVIRGINTNANTPLWMQERLRRSGIRGIHSVVDIMNYVMLELGQPLHAFDLNKLEGGIQVRAAKEDESIALLDGQHLQLKTSTLVIADGKNAQAIAGIMGGLDSSVTPETRDLFLESAFFSQVSLGIEARAYTLQTDASYRFERGVDPELPRVAMNRACELLMQFVGGQLGPITEVVSVDALVQRPLVSLVLSDVPRLLGMEIAEAKIEEIFSDLSIQIISKEKTQWLLKAPSFRFDLNIAADFIEEIARLVGYDQIPPLPEYYPAQIVADSAHELRLNEISKTLVDQAYHEVISYSFINSEWHALFNPHQTALRLANPLTQDMAVMRTSLWPGLLTACQYNQARQCERLRIFEKGLCFEGEQQRLKIGGLIIGDLLNEQWGQKSAAVDFFDLKSNVEAIVSLSGYEKELQWQPAVHPALHPGQGAQLLLHNQILGHVGALHPRIAQALDLKRIPYLFELDFEVLKKIKPSHYSPLSKFPVVRRDLAMIMNKSIKISELQEKIQEELGECLNNLIIFDIYEGQHIAVDKKSVAVGLVFQDPSRTLVDEEINNLLSKLLKRLEQEFDVILRN